MHSPSDLLQAIAAAGVAVCPTLGHDLSHLDHRPDLAALAKRAGFDLDGRLTQVGELHRAGVVLASGVDSGINPVKPHGLLPEAVIELTRAGVSATAALASATALAAQACGLAHRTGHLRVPRPHRPLTEAHPGWVSRRADPWTRLRCAADRRRGMRIRPVRLNAAIASLFIAGSACFLLGSVPAYANAVTGFTDGVTFFVGSVFFTTASFLQLLQAQTSAMTGVDAHGQRTPQPVRLWRWLPHDRNWLAAVTQFPGTLFFNVSTLAVLAHNASVQEQDKHVWRPDIYGSTLFLIASAFGILAVGIFWSWQPQSLPWYIAWLNMIGSVLFMISALASFVLPATGDVINLRVDIAGTLLGALCFLIGAAVMFPAWRRAVANADAAASHPKERA